MEWRAIPGHPDFEVSECGDVRRVVQGRRYPAGYVLKPKPHQRGYVRYTLSGHDVLAHRIVALAFIGAPPSSRHQVAHEDGTRTNNHWTNLAWKLPVDNQADRKRHGTFHSGVECSSAKLSDAQVDEIRAAYASGGVRFKGGSVTMQALADGYGVSVGQISRVVNGRQRLLRSGQP